MVEFVEQFLDFFHVSLANQMVGNIFRIWCIRSPEHAPHCLRYTRNTPDGLLGAQTSRSAWVYVIQLLCEAILDLCVGMIITTIVGQVCRY